MAKRRSRRTRRSASFASTGRRRSISAVVASTTAPRYCALDACALPPMASAPTTSGSVEARCDGSAAKSAAVSAAVGSGSFITARAIRRSAGVAFAIATASGRKIGSAWIPEYTTARPSRGASLKEIPAGMRAATVVPLLCGTTSFGRLAGFSVAARSVSASRGCMPIQSMARCGSFTAITRSTLVASDPSAFVAASGSTRSPMAAIARFSSTSPSVETTLV